MPRKNFYISVADEKEVYEKAKKYAGESLSSVIVDGLKAFVMKQESLEKGLEEIKLWVGVKYHKDSRCEGNFIKFFGKLIAEDSIKKPVDRYEITKIYYTKKGKILLYNERIRPAESLEHVTVCEHEVLNSVDELKGKRVSNKIIEEADLMMPDLLCKDLDI